MVMPPFVLGISRNARPGEVFTRNLLECAKQFDKQIKSLVSKDLRPDY